MVVKFKKKLIDRVPYESASVLDVNNNGKLDIVCGEYWYEAPDWKKHKICDVTHTQFEHQGTTNIMIVVVAVAKLL